MAKQRTLQLRYPMGGVVEGVGYQSQPPYTTRDAQNVRPFGAVEDAARGGSRPGWGPALHYGVGYSQDDSPVQLIAEMDIQDVDSGTAGHLSYIDGHERTYRDNFDGEVIGGFWSRPSNLSNDPTFIQPTVIGRASSTAAAQTSGVVSQALDCNFDDSDWCYSISAFLVPVNGSIGDTSLHLFLDDTSPQCLKEVTANSDGLHFRFRWEAGENPDFHLIANLGGAQGSFDIDRPSYVDMEDTLRDGGWLTLMAYRQGGVDSLYYRAIFRHQSIVSGAVSWDPDGATEFTQYNGTRAAISFLGDDDDSPWGAGVSEAYIRYPGSGDKVLRPYLIYAKDGRLRVERSRYSFSDYDLNYEGDESSVRLRHAVLGTTIYIGHPGRVYMRKWSPSGLLEYHTADGFPVEDGGNHYIYTIADMCVYRNRLAVAPFYSSDPGSLALSRYGDASDFNFGADETDFDRAYEVGVSGTGKPNDVITALIPASNDYLIIGCEGSVFIMRGDLSVSGSIDRLTGDVGISGFQAWCYGPVGEIYFMSSDGLYVIPPGGGYPEPLSRDRLPTKLRDAPNETANTVLLHNPIHRGVHIFRSGDKESSKLREAWWYDFRTKSFWADVIPGDTEPFSKLQSRPSGRYGGYPVIGARDYTLVSPNSYFYSDNDTAFTSSVMIGPIRMSDADQLNGVLAEIWGIVGQYSGDVDWSVHSGDNAYEALNASASASGTWSAGTSYRDFPRVRGTSLFLKLTNGETTTPWVIEQINARFETGGMSRMV